jgi:hypothetical protein
VIQEAESQDKKIGIDRNPQDPGATEVNSTTAEVHHGFAQDTKTVA